MYGSAHFLRRVAAGLGLLVTLPIAVGGVATITNVGSTSQPSARYTYYDFLPSGTADDAARFNALVALGWRNFVFYEGLYRATTSFILQSHVHIWMDRRTEIRFVLPTAVPLDACFSCFVPASVATAALTTVIAPGQRTFIVGAPTVPGTLVPGTFVILYNPDHPAAISLFKVEAVAPSGPNFAVTVDRGVERLRNLPNIIGIYAAVNENIAIHGNGARISGVADRAHELSIAWKCLCEGVVYTDLHGSLTGPVFSFDIPSFNCEFADCGIEIDNTVPSQPGFYVESNTQSRVTRCYSRKADYGAQLIDCTDCTVSEYTATAQTYGVVVGAGTGDLTQGGLNNKVENTVISACTIGVFTAHGSINTKHERVTTYGCNVGLYPDASTKTTNYDHCSTYYSIEIGLQNQCGNTSVTDHVSLGDSQAGILNGSGGVLSITRARIEATKAPAQTLICAASSKTTVNDSDLTWVGGVGPLASAATGNISLTLDDVRLNGPANSHALLFGGPGSVLYVEKVVTNCASNPAYFAIVPYDPGAASVRVGLGNNFASCATFAHPIINYLPRRFTLTGTVPVAVAFPDIRATDDEAITISRRSVVGAVGNISCTVTPGVGLSLVSDQATDTGVVSIGLST